LPAIMFGSSEYILLV